MPPVIDQEKCIACGTCAQICPDEVFRLERKKGEIPTIHVSRRMLALQRLCSGLPQAGHRTAISLALHGVENRCVHS